GMVTQPARVSAVMAPSAATATRRIRLVRSVIDRLLEWRAVCGRQVDGRDEDAHASLAGQGQPEAGSVSDLRPHLQCALVQRGVFKGDREAETCSADGALA